MKILQHTCELENVNFGATIGNFDGVHLGHIAMLNEVRKNCEQRKLAFAVITFFPHPSQILKVMRGFLLNDYEERRELLKNVGVEYLIEIPFTKDFSSMTAQSFVNEYVKNVEQLQLLCLGYDFAFGAHKSGDFSTFEKMLKGTKTELLALDEFKTNAKKISSSAIRDLIRSGEVQKVNELLGRNFSLTGTVVKGKGRGKGIGFPTANLHVTEEIIAPSTGVYATKSYLNGQEFASVTNIGFNPTFSDSLHMTIETHLLQEIDDFYDQQMTVEFFAKIREEKRFSSVEELKKQIAKDAQIARTWPND